VAENFRWLDPDRTDTARGALEQEGVTFNESGEANPGQRLTAEDLAVLSGLELDAAQPVPDDEDSPGRSAHFHRQLAELQPASVVARVHELLEAWVHLGGAATFGRSQETSCFLMCDGEDPRSPWPCTIYPSGRIEIVFQYMAARPPFDDVGLRQDFRERLDSIPGISVPPSKIELRPSLSMDVLTDQATLDSILEHLAWYIETYRAYTDPSTPST
jgi:hypothetical protein